MIYGYVRVSTRLQGKEGNSLLFQKQQLIDAGAEEIYEDIYTGTTTERPSWNLLLSKLKPGDCLMVTKLDRIARSAIHGSDIIQKLINDNIAVYVLNMGKMDNTPAGKLLCNMMFAFAEFERDLIVERTQEGRNVARTREGYKEGRPLKYSTYKINHALDLLENYSYKEVERMTGISKSTLIRAHKKKTLNEI